MLVGSQRMGIPFESTVMEEGGGEATGGKGREKLGALHAAACWD
jgi:hypothetical protein